MDAGPACSYSPLSDSTTSCNVRLGQVTIPCLRAHHCWLGCFSPVHPRRSSSGFPSAFTGLRHRPWRQFPLLVRSTATSFGRGQSVRRLQLCLGYFFWATQFCQHAMRSCSVGLPYTRYTHHGTRDNYTRYPEYETTTRRRHNTSQTTQQDHNILIEFHLTTPLHVFSDLHFAYFTVTGTFPVGYGHGLREVFCSFWFTVDPGSQRLRGPLRTCPLAPTDWSLHMTVAFCDCFGNPRSAVSTVSFFLLFFLVSFTAGSPYRECLHREIDGTVWTPTIKNSVIVMLYPPYTPLSLIITSLRAPEDQTNVSPRPTTLLNPSFPFVHQSVDFCS